jgi:hypothetical protein
MREIAIVYDILFQSPGPHSNSEPARSIVNEVDSFTTRLNNEQSNIF